jgi:peptide/nickel transport system substrate-binding protein
VRPGAVGGALALLVVLGGCTAAAPATSGASSTGAHGAPLVSVDGGTATVAVDAVPTTLNDHTVAGDDAATREVASLVWAQVFQVAPNMSPTLDTDVVDSAEVVNVDPQTVVYQINPKAVWSDGTPVSSQDFVYAWLSQNGSGRDVDGSPDSVASTAGYSDISSVVGSNNGKTVTVVFQNPYSDWPSLFDDLLPAHIADKVGWNHGFDRFDPATMVSAGPWMVSSWTPGRRMVLVRNPHWWGTPPRLDQLVLEADPEAGAVAAALGAGQVQVAAPSSFGPAFEASISSSPRVESIVQLGTTMLTLDFNVRAAPLDDQSVRQGIAHLIDRASLVTTLVQPTEPLAWEDNDHLFANSEPWYSDDAAGYEQPDPQTAAQDLTQAGLVADAQGTWTWHGAPLPLELVWASDDPWSAAAGPAIAAQLLARGFDVTADPTTMANLEGSVLPSGAFDLALVPLGTTPYPTQLAPAFGVSPGASNGAVQDWTGFDDPRIDGLFTQASQQLGAAQDRQLYQQIDAALWTAMPSLPLFAEPAVTAWSAKIFGVRADPGGLGPLWSVSKWAYLVPARTTGGSAQRRARPSRGMKGPR